MKTLELTAGQQVTHGKQQTRVTEVRGDVAYTDDGYRWWYNNERRAWTSTMSYHVCDLKEQKPVKQTDFFRFPSSI